MNKLNNILAPKWSTKCNREKLDNMRGIQLLREHSNANTKIRMVTKGGIASAIEEKH